MRKVLVLLAIAVFALPVHAQWRRAALYGADVRALIIDRSDPDTLYLGTSGGEIYVSHDGAKSWYSPRNGVPFPGYIVDSLLLDRDGRLWAASWGLWGGGVIAVSYDGGHTWARRDNGLEDFSVRAIAVDQHDPNYLLAGGLTGVYRSMDGGVSWNKISDQENVESVAIDPRTHDRLYVGTWRQGYRSEDGGKTWALINNGMVLDTDMFAITFNSENPDDMWVATCGWVYNTKNRGDNWVRYRDGFDNRRVHDVQISPCDHDTIYAGTVGGLYRSEDAGKLWYRVSDEDLVINTIAMDTQRPDRIVLGVEGDGIYVSNDAGKTYTRSCEGLRNLTVTSIAADPAVQKHVYAAVAFGGMSNGIYESGDAGVTWKKISATQLPTVLSLTMNDDKEVKFIAGTEKGFFWSADGATWTQAPPSNAPIRVDKVIRFNRIRFFAATADGVYTTRDAGKNWYRLADSGTRAVDLSVGALGENRALFALTSNGVIVFDGERWSAIDGAPAKGRTIAVRNLNGSQFIFVAGMQGVRAGRVDIDRKWHEAEVPDAQGAAVFNATDLVFLTSRKQRDVLVSGDHESQWNTFPLPTRTAEVSSVAVDPFNSKRLYLGTLREGLFVFEGEPQRYESKSAEAGGSDGAGWRQ